MLALRISAAITGAVYLSWRLAYTWQGAQPIMFFLLLSAEAFGFVRLLMETSMLDAVRPETRTPVKTLAPDADVIVVVTDEPASEVRAAVLSARLISGYYSLQIVDRDDRPDVAELASRLGFRRIVGGMDADLGELVDEALHHCTALFALLMPADLVVMPDVLEVTAGAFDHSEVGVVACRIQNTNAAHEVDYGGYGEHRSRDELMPSRLDDAGALPWWPGMAVVRRSAIAEIGGMSRGRHGVTLATGIRLQAAGWKITDVPVIVARRLAPWNDDRLLHRWARDLYERLAVLVDKDSPRRNPHSTRLSRRVYRAADLHVGRGIQRLVLIGLLLSVLFTDLLPMVADPRLLVPLWSAWMASSVLSRWVAQGSIGFLPWIINDLRLLATDLVVASRVLSGRPLATDLVDAAPGQVARKVFLVGLQVALTLSLVVFSMGILRPPHARFATLASLLLAAWLLAMCVQARTALRFRQERQNFRTTDELEVLASDGRLDVIGVSPFGLDVISAEPLSVGAKVYVAFALPRVSGDSRRFDCATVVRRSKRNGSHHIGYLRFAQLSDAEVDWITEYCAVVAGHRELRDQLPDEEPVVAIAATVVQPRVS